jgi:hypothetical protein
MILPEEGSCTRRGRGQSLSERCVLGHAESCVERNYDLGFRVGRTLSAGAGAITAAPGVPAHNTFRDRGHSVS